MRVEIKNIEFESENIVFDVKKYPDSGFFMAKNNATTDLVFVNKKDTIMFAICPEEIFNNIVKTEKEKEVETTLPIINAIETKQKYDGDFILEFSRILLNRK